MNPGRALFFKNATLFDGSGTSPIQSHIHVEGNRLVAWGSSLPKPPGAQEIPLDGLYISPGWIDLHTHVFEDNGIFSVAPDQIGLHFGVTTLVDAGSAGALNFNLFTHHVVSLAKERIFAYANVCSPGIPHGHAGVRGFIGDHFDERIHSEDLALALFNQSPEGLIGWKARLTAVLADGDPSNERHALQTALRLRDQTGLPAMIHHIKSTIPSEELLDSLQRRDVYTHLYHGHEDSLFDPNTGQPSRATVEARARGVLFDVGHGSGAFHWETVEKACLNFGFWPDVISSDLHRYNLFWPVRDLATTMSKFLHLGAPVEKVISMVTNNASGAIGHQRLSGAIGMSLPIDLTIFAIEQGNFDWADSRGSIRRAKERISPLAVYHNGNLTPCYGFYNRAITSDEFARNLQAASNF